MSHGKIVSAQSQDIQVCSISFNMTDRIRLIGLSLDVINSMRCAISTTWGSIQNERDYHGAYEFKLCGNPWKGQGKDAVSSRRLLAGILKTMALYGWNLVQAADVSKQPGDLAGDKDALFFENGTPDSDVQLFAMSFNERDKIRIIDAPSFSTCVENAVDSQWPYGYQSERNYFGAIELKLRGDPWAASGSDTVYVRMLLCQMMANVRAYGYKLYGSIDISIGYKGMDLDSWIFRKVSPAWH